MRPASSGLECNDLKNRGVKDVLFFCVDGLAGFKEAIQAVDPQAAIQRCVIHMLRNSFKYLNYNDLKKFSADFKAVYNAPNEDAALSELNAICEKWGKKYPYAIRDWENNWEDVSSFFQFSDDIRRIKKMDAEMPELGPGTEPVDCPVRGTNHGIPVKGKAGTVDINRHCSSKPYSVGICIIAKNLQLYSRGRVWAGPAELLIIQMPFFRAKKYEEMYKIYIYG